MVKTIKEFQNELRAIREEMYDAGENADAELVASWLDRLLISLDHVGETLDLMAVELEVLSKRPAQSAARKPAQKKAVKMKKPEKKKAAKKSVKKKAKPRKMAKKPAKKRRR